MAQTANARLEAPNARLEAQRPSWRLLRLGWKPGLRHKKPDWMPPRPGWRPPKEALKTCKRPRGLALEAWPPWPGINPLKPLQAPKGLAQGPLRHGLGPVQSLTGEMHRRTYVCTDVRVHIFPCCIRHDPFWGRCSKTRNHDNYGRESEVKTDRNDI